jgi:hypothetical protein
MRAAHHILLLVAALFALAWQPVASAFALEPQTSAAAEAAPCSACSDMQGSCTKECLPCDRAMPSCRAGLGCGAAVAIAPTLETSCVSTIKASDAPSALAELHGRSVKPEIHPPSTLDQKA